MVRKLGEESYEKKTHIRDNLANILTAAILIYLYIRGTAPLEEKYQEALARAQDIVRFSSVEHIDWFHYEEAYTIIEGRDLEGTSVIVWVPENEKGEIKVVKASDGLSKEDALALLQTGLPDLAAESRPGRFCRSNTG